MRKILIAAAVLAVSVTSAEAICTKKSLNGNWNLGVLGSFAVQGTAAGGTFTFPSANFAMTLASYNSKSCKGSGTGTSSGTPFTFTINSEKIPGTSQKPNQLFVDIVFGSDVLSVTLQRR
jgi:hypothetical protein